PGNSGETAFHDPALLGHAEYLAIGTVGGLGEFSQVIPTIAGQKCRFSFTFSSDGAAGNQFQALWNGAVVMSASSTPYNPGWASFDGSAVYTFLESATGVVTTIAFAGEGEGTSYVGVDDVYVDPVPEPTGLAFVSFGLFSLFALRRRRRM